MDESSFWLRLEFRVCGEFAGLRENHLRYLWCDGFTPEQYLLEGPSPCIRGRAWIADDGSRYEEWEFTLFLSQPFASRSEIEWQALLPPDNVTHWLAVDPTKRRMEIEPAAAGRDPP